MYWYITLSHPGDNITHPLGRFSKLGFLDDGEGVLNTTTNDASRCAQPSGRNIPRASIFCEPHGYGHDTTAAMHEIEYISPTPPPPPVLE